MNVVEASPTSRWVRSPAGRRWTWRSYPMTEPRIAPIASLVSSSAVFPTPSSCRAPGAARSRATDQTGPERPSGDTRRPGRRGRAVPESRIDRSAGPLPWAHRGSGGRRQAPAPARAGPVRSPAGTRTPGGPLSRGGGQLDVERDLVAVLDRAQERAVGAVPEARLQEPERGVRPEDVVVECHLGGKRHLAGDAVDRELAGHPVAAVGLPADRRGREPDRREPGDVELVGPAHGTLDVPPLVRAEVPVEPESPPRRRLVDAEPVHPHLHGDRARLRARGVVVDRPGELGRLDGMVVGEAA